MSDTATLDTPPDASASPDATLQTTPSAPEPTQTQPPTDSTTTPPPTDPVYFKPDGSFEKDWFLKLGDEFAPHHATLERFKSTADLAKSYIHLRTTGPAYPGPDSSPEDIARFRALAQVPESLDGYLAAKPAELPQGMDWNDEAFAKASEIAHKNHIPAPAWKAIVEFQTGLAAEALQKAADEKAATLQKSQDALIGEWRGNYETNKSIVRHLTERLAESAGIPNTDPAVAELASTPAFARIMLQVSKLTAEDSVRTPAGFGDLRTPQQRADEIMTGKDPQWGEKYQNGDRQAMQIVADLLEKARQ